MSFIIYTTTSRSKFACAALGLQNSLCQTVQYNAQSNECILMTDRIPSNVSFIPDPTSFIINLNRNPCIGTQTITFDDIPNPAPSDNAIPSSYACFNWINGWYINATINTTAGTGYQMVLTSGQYVALNRNGTALTIGLTNGSFNVVSLWASAAYTDGLQLSINGSRNSMSVYVSIFTLYTYQRTSIQLNWTDIDTITFSSYKNQGSNQLSGLGYQFAMDDPVVAFL